MKDLVRAVDSRERAVVGWWRHGHLSAGTIIIYLQWVQRFIRAYAGPRLRGRVSAENSRNLAGNALHAWACALGALGVPLPPWREKNARRLSPLMKEYCHYRRAHNGVSESTLGRDVETACGFLRQLRRGTQSIARATLADVDAFVRTLAKRLSR